MNSIPGPVLVTGGNGFLGSHLISTLHASGVKTISFDRTPPPPRSEFVLREAVAHTAFVQGDVAILADLLDAARHHNVRSVVHLATQQDIEFADAHPIATYRTNVLGVLSVLETARILGLRRIVVGSSMAALVAPRELPVSETSATFDPSEAHPTGHYGASKAAAEIIALAYHGVYGLDAIVLRFPSIYGFGSPHLAYVGPAIEAAVRGEAVAFAAGMEARRDYLYVKDAARAILCALAGPAQKSNQRLFLIATGSLSTAADVARMVEQVVPGANVTVGPGQSPLEARVAPIRVPYDVSSSRLTLGFAPQYDLKAGIADYAATYREFLRSMSSTEAA